METSLSWGGFCFVEICKVLVLFIVIVGSYLFSMDAPYDKLVL